MRRGRIILLRLSVVIPAYNEERYLPACIESVRRAMDANRGRLAATEVIVADNNSTDRTAEVARRAGARVVFEPENQISRARNAGAAVAGGDWLLFVDADTTVPPETVRRTLHRIGTGRYVGGGCRIVLDDAPPAGRLLCRVANECMRAAGCAGGAFLFCRADAFRAVGGFRLEVFAGEEVFLSRDLTRWGRRRGLGFLFMNDCSVTTSARKLEHHTPGEFVRLCIRGALRPRKVIGSREHLGFFYDAKR